MVGCIRQDVDEQETFGITALLSTSGVAMFSAPTAYRLFAADQPTVAIFYWPFVWLPALVGPLMLWAHFVVLGRSGQAGGGARVP